MQDRYLCKAKGQTDNKWHIGFLTMLSGEVAKITDNEFLHTTWICDSSTLCRCTGLKDKSGKLIWENDILEARLDDKFPDDITRTRAVWEKNGWVTIESESVDMEPLDDFDTEHFEVVGNVFDNPELLEVQE